MSWVAVAIGGAAVIGAGVSMYSSGKASDAQAESAAQAGDYSAAATIKAAEIAADAQKEAARLQTEASDRATGELRRQYDVTTGELAPWREAGVKGLATYEKMVEAGPGEFETSPGYQFRLGEGLKAIEQSAAARGKQLSGQTSKALTEYAQGVATGEYDSFLQRYYQSLLPYQDLSAQGLGAAARTGQIGQSTAQGIAGIQTGTASNIASGLLASAANQGQYTMAGGAGQANAMLQAGQARASGYINQANSVTSALQNALSLYALSNIFKGGGLGGGGGGGGGTTLAKTGTVSPMSQYINFGF